MDATLAEDADLPKELRDKYTVSRTLGRGACGEVRLAFVKGSCHRVAIKIVQKKKFENSESQKV
jgi:serine/threonine-protein kinase Chk2